MSSDLHPGEWKSIGDYPELLDLLLHSSSDDKVCVFLLNV